MFCSYPTKNLYFIFIFFLTLATLSGFSDSDQETNTRKDISRYGVIEFILPETDQLETLGAAQGVISDIADLRSHGIELQHLFSRVDEIIKLNPALSENSIIHPDIPQSRWFIFKIPQGSTIDSTFRIIRSLGSVKSVYPLPEMVPASLTAGSAIATSATPDFTKNQAYLRKAKKGIDAQTMWKMKGGSGTDVTVADIGGDWNYAHSEFPHISSQNLDGQRTGKKSEWYNHGTAVLGVLSSAKDDVGTTGISYGSSVKLFSFGKSSSDNQMINNIADAIDRAADSLNAGDIMVITAQHPGINIDEEYLPVEYDDSVYSAIKSATSKGIIVVEAAGNGGENLDNSLYKNKFSKNRRDSGAIMVGAGATRAKSGVSPTKRPKDRSRLDFSNYGSRVDLQGWGQSVATTGYGDLYGKSNDAYTSTFGGTAAATAMVAGAAAALQGYARETIGRPLKPKEMLDTLVKTGSSQVGQFFDKIGPLPNLKAAIQKVNEIAENELPKVTSPAAGFNWRAYTYQDIKWKNIPGGNVTIDRYQNSAPQANLTKETKNDGTASWGLSRLGNDYQIRVASNSEPDRFAFSEKFIINGTCPITSPPAGSEWSHGDVLPIRWSHVTGSTVYILIYNNDTGEGGEIDSTANDGRIDLNLPDFLGTGERMTVDIWSNTNSSGAFSPFFTIGEAIPEVSRPAPGFAWRSHTFQNVKWKGMGAAYVIIDLYQNSGYLRNMDDFAENDGEERLPINGAGQNYQIRVKSNADSSRYAYSGNFSVYGSSPVTSPSQGQSFAWSSVMSIRWSYVTGSYVAIVLGNGDTGEAWWVTQFAINDGSWDVSLNSSVSTGNNYFLLISSLTDDSAIYSDAFSITSGAPMEDAIENLKFSPLKKAEHPLMNKLLRRMKSSMKAPAIESPVTLKKLSKERVGEILERKRIGR